MSGSSRKKPRIGRGLRVSAAPVSAREARPRAFESEVTHVELALDVSENKVGAGHCEEKAPLDGGAE